MVWHGMALVVNSIVGILIADNNEYVIVHIQITFIPIEELMTSSKYWQLMHVLTMAHMFFHGLPCLPSLWVNP